MSTYRVGRKVGRTIYRQTGPEPSDADELIGLMDTAGLAEFAVRAMNRSSTAAKPAPNASWLQTPEVREGDATES